MTTEEIKKELFVIIEEFPKDYSVTDIEYNNLSILCSAHFKDEPDAEFIITIAVDDNGKTSLVPTIIEPSLLRINDFKELFYLDLKGFETRVNKLVYIGH